MADKTTPKHDTLQDIEASLSNTEMFIERNQKKLLLVLAAIVVVVGGVLAYKQFIVKPKEAEAQTAMFRAEIYFEKDSFNLALNGKGDVEGFLSIIDNYSGTKSGNLAHFYAGVCYLQTGKFQEAIDQFDAYDGEDIMTASMAMGAKGDALMELGKTQDAIDQYVKAAGKNENSFSSPMYLMKAGIAYEEMKNYDKALEIYQKVQKDFYQTSEGREADKYIARVEGLKENGGK
jgi:tetratricopeptide (TPR) repeat protein